MKFFYLAIFALLLGCAGKEVRKIPPLSREAQTEAIDILKRRVEARQTLSGFGSLSLSLKERKGTGHSVLQLQWPDKFRLEFQDPIGGRQLLLQFTKDFVFVDEPKAPESYLIDIRSPQGLAEAKELFQLGDLGSKHFELWLRIFLARPDLTDFVVDSEDQRHLLKYRGSQIAQELRLNSDGDIKEWYIPAADEESESVHLSYESYQRKGSAIIPGLVKLTIESGHRKGGTLIWRWQDWEPNAGRESLLELPPKKNPAGRKIKKAP